MTNRSSVTRVLLVTTTALAVLGLAACGVSGQPSASGGATTSNTQAVGSGPGPAATTPVAAGTGGTGATHAGGRPERSAAGGTPECKPGNLTLSLSGNTAELGTFYQYLRFTNSGTTSCVIVGYPGVSFVAGPSGAQVGAPASRFGSIGKPVTLHPKQVAFATLSQVDPADFDASACNETSIRGFRVYPPDSTASMFVAQPGTACSTDPQGSQLEIWTIAPGMGHLQP